jgi:hypothetical protein
MGEEKHSPHEPRYTNINTALSPPNMINCHYLCPIVHTTTTTTRGMRLCIEPHPVLPVVHGRFVRFVHDRFCPDVFGALPQK